MNYRSDREANLEIYLQNVCIASRNFQVQQLEGQVHAERNLEQSSFRIGWQERITLHYLVVPVTTTANCFSTSSPLLSSGNDNTAFDKSLLSSNSKHITDFVCRERAHEIFSVSTVVIITSFSNPQTDALDFCHRKLLKLIG